MKTLLLCLLMAAVTPQLESADKQPIKQVSFVVEDDRSDYSGTGLISVNNSQFILEFDPTLITESDFNLNRIFDIEVKINDKTHVIEGCLYMEKINHNGRLIMRGITGVDPQNLHFPETQ